MHGDETRVVVADLRRSCRSKAVFGLGLAALLCAFIVVQVWPGFMSYDSVFALQQARTGIVSSEYPPALSYVWCLLDRMYPGPGLMLVCQVVGILGATALFSGMVTCRLEFVIPLVTLVAVSPAAVGPMTVIWKDIWMTLFISLAICAIVMHFRGSRVIWPVCLCLAMSFRLNSLPAIVPIVWLGARAEFSQPPAPPNLSRTMAHFIAISIVIVVVAGASLLWRLPDFARLPPPFNPSWTQVYDLLGMSVCAEKVLVPPEFLRDGANVATLKEIYRPQHVQMSFDMSGKRNTHLLDEGGFARLPQNALSRAWQDAVQAYPACYLWHRANVARVLLGLNHGPVFYKYHGAIDANGLGVPSGAVRSSLVTAWLDERTGFPLLDLASDCLSRVWVFMSAAVVAFIGAAVVGRGCLPGAACVLASVVLYTCVNIVLVPAADLRYEHWPVVGSIFVVALALCSRSNTRKTPDQIAELSWGQP